MALLKTLIPRQLIVNTHRAIISTIRPSSTDTKQNEDEPVDIENPFKKEPRQCILCKLNITPNYKNYRLLSQFQSPYTGRIYGRHITGLCQAKQALVETEITKAQNCALMPYYYKDKVFLKDPKLFDPENPIRSHRF
ncbi:small ribosomal subunit protein bS18m [Plodia interpunctella]|uniref:small ribosomal subunit protein bS18m n=1 Tax=Plodia interpunctella TaxID=58824 RepID=UPI002367F521|nr:28S ribosomal protein S18c, mitochondrial [Plodia interpunctella]